MAKKSKKMPEEKDTPPATWEEKGTPKAAKEYKYVGPTPAPLISNLLLDLKQPRLGTLTGKFPADRLFEELGAAYVEYVMATNTAAKNWWK